MMKTFWRLFIAVLVSTIMIVVLVLDLRSNARAQIDQQNQGTLNSEVGTSVGKLAPDFQGKTLEGELIHLSELRGKTVLINVFASWCGPCRLEMPHLVNTHEQLNPNEFAFVGINLRESPEAVAQFQQEFNINYSLIINERGDLTDSQYTPIGLPTTWFIDSQGMVRYVYSGAMTEKILLRILEDVQAGREPDPFAISG